MVLLHILCTDEKWKELTHEQRQEKEQFLRNEGHVSKSFMEMVRVNYDLLQLSTIFKKHWLDKHIRHKEECR